MECGWKLICLTQVVDAVNGILMNVDFARKIRMFENFIKTISSFLIKFFGNEICYVAKNIVA